MLLSNTDFGVVYYTALLKLCYSSNKFEKKILNPYNFLRNTFGQNRLKKKYKNRIEELSKKKKMNDIAKFYHAQMTYSTKFSNNRLFASYTEHGKR